jgi:hypothetical protein
MKKEPSSTYKDWKKFGHMHAWLYMCAQMEDKSEHRERNRVGIACYSQKAFYFVQ